MQNTQRPARTGALNEESMVGRAHHALRAYVKAFSVRDENPDAKYSFSIAPDRQSAAVLDPSGQVVLNKKITELAHEGSQVRLALAALRDVKESLEAAQPSTRVRYRLDLLENLAELTVGDTILTKAQFIDLVGGKYRAIGDSASAVKVVETSAGETLNSIACWADIGRPIAAQLFSLLASAEEYKLTDAANEQRERAYRLGLIHRRVT